jgi:tetratricopeptide (TPR) repeat protein
LKALREARGLSLRALGGDDISAGYLSRVEAGQRVPSQQVLRILAPRLGVSVAKLAGRDQAIAVSEDELQRAELGARLGAPEAETEIEALLAQARGLGDARATSRLLEALGQLRVAVRDDEGAVRLLEEARAATAGADARARPSLYEGLGRAYAGLGDVARSVGVLKAAFEQALAEPPDPALVLRFGVFLANAYTDQGAPSQAVSTLTEVVRFEEQARDPHSRARLEWTLCRTYGEAGRTDVAERYARRVVAALEENEESQLRGLAHLLLAGTLITSGNADEAEPYLATAAQLMEAAPAPERAVLDYWRAQAALLRGDDEEADRLARRSVAETESTEPSTAGMAYVVLAKVARRRGSLDDARFLCERAISLLEGTSATQYLADAFETLADVEEAAGDAQAALRAARTAIDVHKRDHLEGRTALEDVSA